MMNTYKEGDREKKMKRGGEEASSNGNELRNMNFNNDGDD
jgi:hypothetical protein